VSELGSRYHPTSYFTSSAADSVQPVLSFTFYLLWQL